MDSTKAIRITDIAHYKGTRVDCKNVKENKSIILNLLIRGAVGFYKRESKLEYDIKKCFNQLLNNNNIDRIFINSSSIPNKVIEEDISKYISNMLNIDTENISIVGNKNCGDSIPLIETAKIELENKKNKKSLLIIIDDINQYNISRIVNNSYFHSDSVTMAIMEESYYGINIEKGISIKSTVQTDNKENIYNNLDYLLSQVNKYIEEDNILINHIVTHNMNNLYLEKINELLYSLDKEKLLYSFSKEGHFLSADILINLEKILKNNTQTKVNGLLLAPTVNSINFMYFGVSRKEFQND